MATVKLHLDTRRAKKNGSFPLVIRIRHQGNYFDITTSYSLRKTQFNKSKESIINNKDATRELHKFRDSYTNKLLQLINQDDNISINMIKSFFFRSYTAELSFKRFWEDEVENLINSNRAGSARVYQQSLNRLSQVIDFDRPISKIKYADLVNAEILLLKSGIKVNSVGVYMRTFRSMCNKAIKLDYVDQNWYPFAKFKIKKEKTVPKPISINDMKKYFELDLKPANPLYKSYIIGKLIFMLRGINLKDLLLLTKDNIKGDRIIYKRSKTKKIYSIKILPQIQELFDYCHSEENSTLLGVLDSCSKIINSNAKAVDYYIQKRKVINSHLKKISTMLEIETPITTYVFRYSYANISIKLGYSKDSVSNALGHEYGNSVTGIYLEHFDLDKLDDMNEDIVNTVLNTN